MHVDLKYTILTVLNVNTAIFIKVEIESLSNVKVSLGWVYDNDLH